jgi:ribose 5-phosphate isomerase B
MGTIKKIGIACDHAGFEMKEKVKERLKAAGYDVKDFGTNSADSVDYPDFAHPLAEAVEKGEMDLGFTLCGSGNGISMVANKHQGVRSALCWNTEISALARQHNNANVCSLPARFISEEEAMNIVDTFVNTEFEGGRHEQRVKKIPLH